LNVNGLTRSVKSLRTQTETAIPLSRGERKRKKKNFPFTETVGDSKKNGSAKKDQSFVGGGGTKNGKTGRAEGLASADKRRQMWRPHWRLSRIEGEKNQQHREREKGKREKKKGGWNEKGRKKRKKTRKTLKVPPEKNKNARKGKGGHGKQGEREAFF